MTKLGRLALILAFCGGSFASADDTRKVLVVSGLKSEQQIALSVGGTISVISGGSIDTLRQALAAVDPTTVKAVVSFGVAGGLNPALNPGDVIVASTVMADDGTSYATDAALSSSAAARLKSRHLQVYGGTMIGSVTEHYEAADKAALFASTGAASIDMESEGAAEYARAHGLPLVVVRTISDPQTLTFPKAVRDALKPDGSIDFAAVIDDLFSDPVEFGALLEVAWDSFAAFGNLNRIARILPLGSL